MKNPFKKAQKEKRNLKLLLFGDSGVGKTTLALKFPKPCVIDLEGGTKLYGDSNDFSVFRPGSYKEVQEAISYLSSGGSEDYETIVIDPITIVWERIQKKWSDILLRRNKDSRGNKQEFYDFQAKDWGLIKQDWKNFLNNLIALPLNVVVICREKAKYADTGFMKQVGETFDAEKSLPYLFDTVVRIVQREDKRICLTRKDRSNTLTTEFPLDYSPFNQIIQGVIPQSKDWRDQPLGFNKTGDLTWLDLLNDKKLPSGNSGKELLENLADWKDRPDIAEKAKNLLAGKEQ